VHSVISADTGSRLTLLVAVVTRVAKDCMAMATAFQVAAARENAFVQRNLRYYNGALVIPGNWNRLSLFALTGSYPAFLQHGMTRRYRDNQQPGQNR
jgi:hypothetical protein